jgi:hypothetical protein
LSNEDKDWLYEVKFDGYRCLAGRDSKKVTLWSRKGNLFTDQFPQIARACERLPQDLIVAQEKSFRHAHIHFPAYELTRRMAEAVSEGFRLEDPCARVGPVQDLDSSI